MTLAFLHDRAGTFASIYKKYNLHMVPLLGKIIAHGFVVFCLAFPIVTATLLGLDVVISDVVYLESLVDYISTT